MSTEEITGSHGKLSAWYRTHEAWIMLTLICCAMYAVGFMSSVLVLRQDYHRQAFELQTSYNQSLADKDVLITKLAQLNAQSAKNAASAAGHAASAAAQAATAVSQAENPEHK